jgi:arabinose-5-phosphate isomerase
MTGDVTDFGRSVLHDEARALDALADSLGEAFEQAVGLILGCQGKLIVSGLGKSGHVGRKIAATFASTGTTATFLHLAEAIHGDLGMAAKGDAAILISQSGETAELEAVIDHFNRVGIPIIAITGNSGSMLAEAATAALILPRWAEVGPEAVAPTTSTTMPLVGQGTSMHDAVLEMSAKRLGVVGVTGGDGELVGIITDGDLRRHIEQGLDHPASAFMTTDPKTIAPDTLVDEALTLFDEYRITTLFVVEGNRPVGVLHIHDCPAAR